MKKLLLFVLLMAGIIACSKNDSEPTPGQIQIEGITGNQLKLGYAENTDREFTVTGIVGQLTATVESSAAGWCQAKVEQSPTNTAEWLLTLTTSEYTGTTERKAYVILKSGDDALTLTVIQTGRGTTVEMVVVSEGQFTKGTAALSAITYSGTSTWDIFRDVNNMPLGDVAQSLTYIDGKYFVALNNSKQVKVIEPQTFKLLGTVDYEQAGSPRFIVPVNDHEAIVSDLQSQLTRIDYKTYEIIEHISIPSSIEKMVVIGNKLFGMGSSVFVFDTNNITAGGARKIAVTGGIMTTAKPIVDKNGNLWVFCTSSGKSVLNCIDPTTETVIKTVDIPYATSGTNAYVEGAITGTSFYTRMDTDRSKSRLYFYMNMLTNADRGTTIGAIYTFDIDKDEINSEVYRELPGLGMMYGMNISPDGEVYLCDCLDYTAQRGFLRHYQADGNVVSQRVGVYPRMVHFTEYDK